VAFHTKSVRGGTIGSDPGDQDDLRPERREEVLSECALSEARKCFQSAPLRGHFEGEAAAGLGTGDADRRGAGELCRQGDGVLRRSAGVGGVRWAWAFRAWE